jgi:hypothetical protein
MTILPGFWRFSIVFLWGILVGVFAALAAVEFVAHQPGEGVVLLVAPMGLYLLTSVIFRFGPRPIRLEITESTVRALQGNWRGAPGMEVPRSEITAIHYFPDMISFRGLDNKPVMMIRPQYTLRQMRKVAAELHVRLFDHSRLLGLQKVNIGRLAYDPALAQASGLKQ